MFEHIFANGSEPFANTLTTAFGANADTSTVKAHSWIGGSTIGGEMFIFSVIAKGSGG